MSDRKHAKPASSGSPKRKRYKPDVESRFLEFGQRLAAAIAEKAKHRGGEYTMADLARDLVPKLKETPVKTSEPDSSTIGLWRKNVQRPSLEKILMIAECLSIDAGWLAFGSYAHPASWPAWAATTWPETGGEVPGERQGRFKPRSVRVPDAYPGGTSEPPYAHAHTHAHHKRGRRRANG